MKPSSKLLSPQKAVENYLDTLLQEVTEPDISGQKDNAVETNSVAAEQIVEPQPTSETPESIADVAPQVVNEQKPQPAEKKTPPSVESHTVIEVPDPAELVETLENSSIQAIQRYDFPMQCLMFNVSGNQLSIPLIDMGSVLPWGGKLTPLPHTPEWFLGLLIHREQKVRVIDTATFMHIQKKNLDGEDRHILVFGDDSWAMTCDQLGDVIKLSEQDVKWSQQGKTGLILGTIKSSLAILLDPKKILLQLNRGV